MMSAQNRRNMTEIGLKVVIRHRVRLQALRTQLLHREIVRHIKNILNKKTRKVPSRIVTSPTTIDTSKRKRRRAKGKGQDRGDDINMCAAVRYCQI